jgi:N-acetylglucosaminyldiphosphoundecaprenol N-acetyl-beta-D-mannosaminyltransferase
LDSRCSINKIDSVFVDGGLQVRLHNMFSKDKINRASFDFSSLAGDFFRYAIKKGLKIALIGAAENEITTAVNNLRLKYPDLQIAYFRNGFFENIDEKALLCTVLKELQIDAVLLGMGTPAQEDMAVYLKDHDIHASIFTCGGFLTQTAKNIDYYTAFTKKTNLRWLQRAIEFKYVRKRLLVDYPRNVIRYVMEHILLFFTGK